MTIGINQLILNKEQIQKVMENEQERLTYDASIRMLAELLESCSDEITPEATRISLLAWITRKAYLLGYMTGIETFNDSFKSMEGAYITLTTKSLSLSEEVLLHMTYEEAETLNNITKSIAGRIKDAAGEAVH